MNSGSPAAPPRAAALRRRPARSCQPPAGGGRYGHANGRHPRAPAALPPRQAPGHRRHLTTSSSQRGSGALGRQQSTVVLGLIRARVCLFLTRTPTSSAQASLTGSLLGRLSPDWGGKLGRQLYPARGAFRGGLGKCPLAPGTPEICIYSSASRDDPVVRAPGPHCDGPTPELHRPPGCCRRRSPAPRRSVLLTRGGREERAVSRSLAVRCNLKLVTASLGISVSWKPGLWAARFSMSSAGSTPRRERAKRRRSPPTPEPLAASGAAGGSPAPARAPPLPQLGGAFPLLRRPLPPAAQLFLSRQHQKPPSTRTHSHTPM